MIEFQCIDGLAGRIIPVRVDNGVPQLVDLLTRPMNCSPDDLLILANDQVVRVNWSLSKLASAAKLLGYLFVFHRKGFNSTISGSCTSPSDPAEFRRQLACRVNALSHLAGNINSGIQEHEATLSNVRKTLDQLRDETTPEIRSLDTLCSLALSKSGNEVSPGGNTENPEVKKAALSELRSDHITLSRLIRAVDVQALVGEFRREHSKFMEETSAQETFCVEIRNTIVQVKDFCVELRSRWEGAECDKCQKDWDDVTDHIRTLLGRRAALQNHARTFRTRSVWVQELKKKHTYLTAFYAGVREIFRRFHFRTHILRLSSAAMERVQRELENELVRRKQFRDLLPPEALKLVPLFRLDRPLSVKTTQPMEFGEFDDTLPHVDELFEDMSGSTNPSVQKLIDPALYGIFPRDDGDAGSGADGQSPAEVAMTALSAVSVPALTEKISALQLQVSELEQKLAEANARNMHLSQVCEEQRHELASRSAPTLDSPAPALTSPAPASTSSSSSASAAAAAAAVLSDENKTWSKCYDDLRTQCQIQLTQLQAMTEKLADADKEIAILEPLRKKCAELILVNNTLQTRSNESASTIQSLKQEIRKLRQEVNTSIGELKYSSSSLSSSPSPSTPSTPTSPPLVASSNAIRGSSSLFPSLHSHPSTGSLGGDSASAVAPFPLTSAADDQRQQQSLIESVEIIKELCTSHRLFPLDVTTDINRQMSTNDISTVNWTGIKERIRNFMSSPSCYINLSSCQPGDTVLFVKDLHGDFRLVSLDPKLFLHYLHPEDVTSMRAAYKEKMKQVNLDALQRTLCTTTDLILCKVVTFEPECPRIYIRPEIAQF